MEGATLNRANLVGADLKHASLREAKLYRADLTKSDLTATDLTGAEFSGIIVGNVALSAAIALDSIRHRGPSVIDVQTVLRSSGLLPEVLLRGAGVPESFITYAKSLTTSAIHFYSCFISYSHQTSCLSVVYQSRIVSHILKDVPVLPKNTNASARAIANNAAVPGSGIGFTATLSML